MVSKASELLPEPETPVTTVSAPWGMRARTPFRLCVRAPSTTIAPPRSRSGLRNAVLRLRVEGSARHLELLEPDVQDQPWLSEDRLTQEEVVVLHPVLGRRRALRLLGGGAGDQAHLLARLEQEAGLEGAERPRPVR